jgi:hypothetical protein
VEPASVERRHRHPGITAGSWDVRLWYPLAQFVS